MIIKKEIKINCTAEIFWQHIVELEKMQEWNVCLLKSEAISHGNITEGFKSKILMQEGKKSVWYENEILEYKPHSHLKTLLKGGSLGKSPMYITYEIESLANGIKVDYINEWEPKGIFMKMFSKTIKKKMDENATNDLQKIKVKAEK